VQLGWLPGVLGMVEEPANPREDVTVNAFDQYVPGFGVTFLLIGMMLGVALTLVDERSWGTLQRLEASGVPLTGLLLGKVASRFVVGVVQMVVLFAVGRVLFGISLGPQPAALLLPTIAMSFAAASLGLVMPTLTDSHDAVMPLGTMVSMAMSAVGGCWWPLDFEPSWMRSLSHALPTTWVMQAYNDLMIRRVDWSAAVWPSAIAFGIGVLYLAVGIVGNVGVSRVLRRIGAYVPARGAP
jgi:ABC-2 type transport system permease protein